MKTWKSEELYNTILALLFVSGVPTEIDRLCHVLEITQERLLECIQKKSASEIKEPLMIQHSAHHLQLVTHPAYAIAVKQWLQAEEKEALSATAKETLAIIAYKQPINRSHLEQIRGLDSRRVLQKLMDRGLIQYAKVPSGGDPRALYYEVSLKFLEHFGLSCLDDFHRYIE